jgi:hypothetical protein
MNIIELFEKLGIDKGELNQFSPDALIRIEKQINVEKKINPEVDSNTASNLIEALKNYPNEFQFIVNHRILFNFFAKKNFSRDRFPKENIQISNEKIKLFVAAFLDEDVKLFFDQKLSQNRFEEMSDLLESKMFFQEDLLFNLNKKAIVKIDYALARMSQGSDPSEQITYIKQRSFYDFLSHFRSIQLDEKLKLILNQAVQIYNNNNYSVLGKDTLIAMSYYEPFEEEFVEVLKRNRNVVYSNQNKPLSNDGSWNSWRPILFISLALIKIVLLAGKCSSNTNTYDTNLNNYNSIQVDQNVNTVLDAYYANMKSKTDSLNNYLVDFDKNDLANLHYNDTIQTGDNPYKYLYKNDFYEKVDSGITIYNKSAYDVILFQKNVIYDSIKMPEQASFIKSGGYLQIRNSDNSNKLHSFYVGKRLATFHNKNERPIVVSNSIEEPRFTELSKNTKELLKLDYLLKNNVYIKNNNETISIESSDITIDYR